MQLTSSLKWWSCTYLHPRLLKTTEQLIYMKDQLTTLVDKLLKIAIPKDHLWCMWAKWYQLLINPDSSHLEESSQAQLPLVKKSELWVLIINLGKKMTFMKNQFKELFLWWVVQLNTFLMYHVVTQLVWSVLINTCWKPEPFLIMKLLITLDLWNIQYHQSSE